jgi:5-methylcytosine-specific restriction endonuclease McrA
MLDLEGIKIVEGKIFICREFFPYDCIGANAMRMTGLASICISCGHQKSDEANVNATRMQLVEDQ